MYRQSETRGGATATAAALTFDPTLITLPDARTRFREAAHAAHGWFEHADLVVDLGSRIGSGEWCRGAFTCFALCAAAWSMGPRIAPLPGAQPAIMGEAQWQEARSSGFSALAYGADTGRRMAATELVETLAETPDRPRIELTATLGRGDGFVRALQRAGVGDGEALRVGDLVSQAIGLGSIEAGTRMDLVLGRRPTRQDVRAMESLKFRAKLDLALAVSRPEGGGPLSLKRIPIAVDDTPLRIQGDTGGSLYRAARAAGAPAKAVETFLRALGSRLSSRAGDRFDMVIAQRRAETGEVELGELLFAGIGEGKRKIQLLKWTANGRTQWFDAAGVGERKGSFQRPVLGQQTSSFGMRFHPVLGFSRLHKGVDYRAAIGTPILAVTDGVVNFAGWHGGHGNFVRLTHAGGLGTGYGHMSRIAVRPGQRVNQGQIIGYAGSTGLSTGPHLHFEVYRNGAAVNPASVSFITQAQLAGAELRNFRATLGRLLSVKPGAPPAFAKRAADDKTKIASSDDKKAKAEKSGKHG